MSRKPSRRIRQYVLMVSTGEVCLRPLFQPFFDRSRIPSRVPSAFFLTGSPRFWHTADAGIGRRQEQSP